MSLVHASETFLCLSLPICLIGFKRERKRDTHTPKKRHTQRERDGERWRERGKERWKES